MMILDEDEEGEEEEEGEGEGDDDGAGAGGGKRPVQPALAAARAIKKVLKNCGIDISTQITCMVQLAWSATARRSTRQ